MKTLALAAVAVAFALAACDKTPADDTASTEDLAAPATAAAGPGTATVVPGPTATETSVATTPGATTTTDANGDRVSVGPDGVSADVGDGDTRVRVNTDNPSMTVEKK